MSQAFDVAAAVHADHLTYLSPEALRDLVKVISRYETLQMDGDIVEAGCAAGGSAIVMAAAKSRSRRLLVYDTFGLIPPPSEIDGADVQERYDIITSGQAEGLGERAYYGYDSNLLATVQSSFVRYGFVPDEHHVVLKAGLFEETLFPQNAIVLAHIDCDWYESVLCCLERIEPHLAIGGTLIFDDYYVWSGCRKAVDEYFADKQDRYRCENKSRRHYVRLS